MKQGYLPDILITGAAIAALLVAFGCASPQPFPDDYGEQEMKRHYENGEMNNYQYQSGDRVFDPQVGATGPTAPTPTPDASTAK
jgi:hypothetical protein